ncbi:bifunctional chorismate-binding protein/class IV aminotransferase [Helicobacter cetorum]|uniref:Para-aminobenzoate synthetase n=1 Tax=Helicobacter cetorum (strain ATCC BAA-540 / CCUG 52418 / MIT 99-5656) TaxID=1163745 RepID=I0ETY7_HELCM|nr:bifunctional anthranilate synthase component I family protein/class IV aminotransferase [Helicobacter cetorum]AFI06406.1 para-aminobenzoate synthetase [Helicobacter cetorum MIT 99-5656]
MIFGDFKYQRCVKKLVATNSNELKNALDFISQNRGKGYFVGYLTYEARLAFLDETFKSQTPFLYFEQFLERKKYALKPLKEHTFYPNIHSSLDKESYFKQFKSIKEHLKNGDTYQVNLTMDLILNTQAKLEKIFEEVTHNQNTPFKAFIENEFSSILSFSPELFFELEFLDNAIKIITKPMKGTIARSNNPLIDEKNKLFLQNDSKNRSENVMIVDLLRNDLSQIALKNSVKVNQLFEIIALPSVYQMVSEIQAQMPLKTSLFEIFKALFPCGSVTGCPKIKTMQIIENLERRSRGVYCGAIGLIEEKRAVFSVPIRTLEKRACENFLHLGVGSGVTYESKNEDEYEESFLKSFFVMPKIEFELVETMRIIKVAQKLEIRNKNAHKERLMSSAKYFNFKYDENLLDFELEEEGVLRVLLQKNGTLIKEYKTLEPLKSLEVRLNQTPINKHNDFLYHKTTYAPFYQKTRELIKKGVIFDEIFYNQDFELTEGARSNLVLEINNELLTPYFSAGALRGTSVVELLKKGLVKHAPLNLQDLQRATRIYCVNALHGLVEVRWIII